MGCLDLFVQVNTIALNPAGTLLASGTKEGTLSVWDLASFSLLHQLTCHSGKIHQVAFSPGVCVRAHSMHVLVYKTTCMHTNAEISDDLSILCVCGSDSHNILSMGEDLYLKVTDVQTGTLLSTVFTEEEQR